MQQDTHFATYGIASNRDVGGIPNLRELVAMKFLPLVYLRNSCFTPSHSAISDHENKQIIVYTSFSSQICNPQ